MKPWKWIFLAILSFVLFLGSVIYPYAAPVSDEDLSKVFYVVEPLFMLQLLGAFWMFYQAIRHEPKPLPYVLLACFVPFAWVWYYFERFRLRNQARREAGRLLATLPGNNVKRIAWICLAILSVAFGVMMVFFYPFKHPLYEELGKARPVIEPILMLQPFCALWMLYQAIRHEPKPLPYVLLACFVPFAWVWYYLEKVRLRRVAGH